MDNVLKKGAQGDEVLEIQKLLSERGYSVKIDGIFGAKTCQAIKAFQSQNLDQHGQPLKIDGDVGPLTWWSLTHPKPVIDIPTAVNYQQMPPEEAGGSRSGRAALMQAINELKAGACEVGGNNSGPWVCKYLAPAGLSAGNPWCASFVSWCFLQTCNGEKEKMPFSYSPSARDLLRKFQNKDWAYGPQSSYLPEPGDMVFWWRVKMNGWQGHVGLVHQLKDGMLYTIEGNKSSRVQGFSYVFSRIDRLLGFGHVPEA